MTLHALKPLIAPLALVAIVGSASQPPRRPPPVHPLGPVLATNTERLTNAASVRELPNGTVLVNENGRGVRRLILFDTLLANPRIVFDSAPGQANYYGAGPAPLIAARGDSSIFVTNSPAAGMAMIVLDGQAKTAAIKAWPLSGPPPVTTGFDAAGRLVMRGPMLILPGQVAPDSAPVTRVDLATRKVDTIGKVRVPRNSVTITRTAQGQIGIGISSPPGPSGSVQRLNPLPSVDDFAVMADGSVAFVRGSDYHIDWINTDGSRSSTGPMAFDWQRLTEEGKAALADSAQRQLDSALTDMNRQIAALQAGAPAGGGGGGGGDAPVARSGGGGVRGGAGDPSAGPTGPPPAPPHFEIVAPQDLPDLRPPFTQGAARADLDNNVWIREAATSATAGLVWDIVSRKGEVVDRVQLPPNAGIIGFGKGGVVYISGTDAAGFHLYRVRVK